MSISDDIKDVAATARSNSGGNIKTESLKISDHRKDRTEAQHWADNLRFLAFNDGISPRR